jgi:hypothetical protein
MHVSQLFLLALVVSGCGGEGAIADGGGERDAAGGDGGTRDAGARDAGAGEPIEAPDETWTAVAIEGARCGNGSALPVAVDLTARSTKLVLFLQGGGACWDGATCFGLGAASHIADTLDDAAVLGEAASLASGLLSRDPAITPFADASFVYVPYCTGDLHAGRNVTRYDWLGVTHEVSHVGAENLDLLLARLRATIPAPERITLVGVSAGGYGVTLNWWRVRDVFPGVRVDVLDDSGTPIDFALDRWPAMKASWALELPPGCDGCDAGFSAVLPHYDAVVDDGRYALLSYRDDPTIAVYAGLGVDVFRARLDALRVSADAARAQYTFVLGGASHVVYATPSAPTSTGVTAAEWVRAFATDAPGFASAGP